MVEKNMEMAKKYVAELDNKHKISDLIDKIQNERKQDKIKANMKSKWAHSIRYYVDLLEAMNIIKKEKRRFGKKKSFGTIIRDVYIFNYNEEGWRVPYRPCLEGQVKYSNLKEIKNPLLC